MALFQNQGEAKIHYGDSDFTIMETGSYVICAVTKEQNPFGAFALLEPA